MNIPILHAALEGIFHKGLRLFNKWAMRKPNICAPRGFYTHSKWNMYYHDHVSDPFPDCYPPDCVIGQTVYHVYDGHLATIVALNPSSYVGDTETPATVGVSFWDVSEHTLRLMSPNEPIWWHFSHFEPIDEEEAALIRIAGKSKKEL